MTYNPDWITMTPDQLQEELRRLAEENQKLKDRGALEVRRSPKGAVSVYGLRRWPVTLYATEWLRVLDISDEIRAFIEANADSLSRK